MLVVVDCFLWFSVCCLLAGIVVMVCCGLLFLIVAIDCCGSSRVGVVVV